MELPMKKWGNKEVVDWKSITTGDEFQIGDVIVVVDENKREMKLSKKAKVYYVRRLVVHVKGRFTKLEVGSTSFKKGSFIKRLVKMTSNETKTETEYFPMVYQDGVNKMFIGGFTSATWWEILNRFADCESKREVGRVFKTYAKYLHPDNVKYFTMADQEALDLLKMLVEKERAEVEERVKKRQEKINGIKKWVKSLAEEDDVA